MEKGEVFQGVREFQVVEVCGKKLLGLLIISMSMSRVIENGATIWFWHDYQSWSGLWSLLVLNLSLWCMLPRSPSLHVKFATLREE
uniref:Uncharacterized protein n=1 Tax=Lactuca sativa TaxID=4236 RepID=A0A9R1UJK0_LACSA|nr:hypothetical protein LSAT_V11C900462850 [Lactuca sativa]